MLDHLISWIPKPKKSIGSAPPKYRQAGRVANCLLFDEAYYLAQLREAGDVVGEYPQVHYVQSGHRKYDPHPDFKAAGYRKTHGLSLDENPLLHYLEHKPIAGDLAQPEQPPIVLAPHAKEFSFEHGRYLYAVAVAFRDAGCPIYLEVPSDVSRERERFPFYEILLSEPWVTCLEVGQRLPDNAICLTDCSKRAKEAPSILWTRARPRKGGHVFLNPIPMHSRQYEQGLHRHLFWLRSRPKTTRIFFSGASSFFYKLPYLRLKYGMVGRPRLLRLLNERFRNQIDPTIGKNFLLKNRVPDSLPMVIADQRFQRSPAVLWMEQLAYADFFLGLPGNYMPMAHNLAESMAVGTIPIMGYPQYLCPELQDGVNCLLYTDEASFLAVVEKALGMSEAEKATLRAGVIEYYDTYMHPAAWAKRLLEASGEHKHLCFPYESVLRGDWARWLTV